MRRGLVTMTVSDLIAALQQLPTSLQEAPVAMLDDDYGRKFEVNRVSFDHESGDVVIS